MLILLMLLNIPGTPAAVATLFDGCDNDRVLNMLQYATVLNMTGYSYNNILIVVTNATTLEFLPA